MKINSYRTTHTDRFAGIIHADAHEALGELPNYIFDVAVTSPPYYWVRDYGFDGQIGHEPTVNGYIEALMSVFDEVKRALRPEGVFFLNLGDTYYSGNGQPHGRDPKCSSRDFLRKKKRAVDESGWIIPKKSLIGIPWRVAIEMQYRGWTLRSAIIWNRVNAFIEPTARDRPYRQYEMVFLFSRSRFYNFNREALIEEDVWNIPIDRTKRGIHNAAFPEELARRYILAGSPSGGWVLDPFAGSGTSLLTALSLSRNAIGIDLGSEYVEGIKEALSEMQNVERVSEDSLHKRMMSGEKSGREFWPGNLTMKRKG